MTLTSRDETDLLLPLLSGAAETAPFSTFLARLQRRTRVVSVSLTIRPGENRPPVALFVGPDIRARAHELDLAELNLTDRIQYDRLRPGRVYSGDEFDDHDLARKARRARDMRKLGLVDERVVRLLDDGEASAWLILASERPCAAADSALLSNLAPYAAAAVRGFVAAERSKLAAVIDDETLLRAGAGWIVFDRDAHVLALSTTMSLLLTGAFGHAPKPGQRLRELGPVVDRALGEAAQVFAANSASSDRVQILSTDPLVPAILTPWRANLITVLDAPVMVAHCRQPRPLLGGAAPFARQFGLPRREAELAMLLASGHSLVEASEHLGLTIETVRNYSKRLFAKVGVRGQAELVSAVYESCAVLA